MSAPSLIWMPGGVSAEALKAAQCPVPGAVVIAPLTQSVRNYGLLGGQFTIVGAPVLGANGATFDGSSRLTIASGTTADFTFICRNTFNLLNSSQEAFQLTANLGAPFVGLGVIEYTGDVYYIHQTGGTIVSSGVVADTSAHTLCLKKTGTTTTLHLDSSLIATFPGSSSTGTITVLGGTSSASFQSHNTIANAVLYHSALSAPDQAAVEAYVAAA